MTVIQSQTFNDSVAAEVRAHMARARVSQTQLALELGWTQAYVSRRLTGQVAFSLDELERIAEALGIPVGELLSPRQLAS